MALSFSKKYPGYALITGASSGIGEAFARQLAATGMDLVLVARSKNELQRLARELQDQYRIKVLTLPVDLTAPEAGETIQTALAQQNIQISFLVNNAGFGALGPLQELDRERQLEMIRLNCQAVVDLTTRFVPEMLKRKNGAIIITSSMAGYVATPFFATYGATKAFDLVFGESLWAELKPQGIDVLVLSPGATRTNFQAVAGVETIRARVTADSVVESALNSLGKRPSVIPGLDNNLLIFLARLLPRSVVAQFSYNRNRPQPRPAL